MSFINDQYEKKLVDEEYKNRDDCFFVKSNKFFKSINAITHLNMPIFFSIRNSFHFKRLLKKITKNENIDAIHAEYTAMGQFYWIKKYNPNIKFTLVEHDVTKQSYERKTKESGGIIKFFMKWQLNLVRKCEKKYCQNSDWVLTLNNKDKNLLKKSFDIDGVVINPYYGLDFKPLNKDENLKKIPNSLCFVGNMSRSENDIAAHRLISIFKRLKESDHYFLSIIGAYPSDDLIKEESKNIHITGFVSNIDDEILKHQIAVFPLTTGAGIKFKILLAAGLGLPVITTDVGAEGIDENGEVLILADTDESFMNEISTLFDNPKQIECRSIESIQYIKDRFSWDKSIQVFNGIYKQI